MNTDQNNDGVIHYYGADAIAKRLGISKRTLQRWIDRHSLPVYARVCPWRGNLHVLYTNSSLLLAWEFTLVKLYHEQRVAGLPRHGHVALFQGMNG